MQQSYTTFISHSHTKMNRNAAAERDRQTDSQGLAETNTCDFFFWRVTATERKGRLLVQSHVLTAKSLFFFFVRSVLAT